MERDRLDTPTAVVRPGRPRSEASHRAVVDAARDLLAERGLEGLRIEAVASRAGVGKATIYRHWGGKPQLVEEVLASCRCGLAAPDTGSLGGDLAGLLDALRAERETDGERLLPRLAELSADPELRVAAVAALVGPREALVAEVLRRAVARGELAADLDVDTAVAMVLGAVLYRVAGKGPRSGPEAAELGRRLAAVLAAAPAEGRQTA